MEKDFFVGIYEPLDVRRNLLESSRAVVSSLTAYDNLEDIRKKKLLFIGQMKKTMEELDFLITRLEKRLPKTHLRKAIQKVPAKQHLISSEVKFSREMEKLSDELQKVEKQLMSMK